VEVVTQLTAVTPEKNKAGSKMTRDPSTWVIKTVCVPWNETNRCEDMINH